MTGIEISLLIIGCIFMLGSFFVSERLSGKEVEQIYKLSDEELKRIIKKELENAQTEIESVIENELEATSEKVEIALEKETNLKIMAVKEYSDTVLADMKHTHEEIMFLYSMLNDKHTELTSLTGHLQRLAADIRNLQEGIQNKTAQTTKSEVETEKIQETAHLQAEDEPKIETVSSPENHNDMILQLFRQGFSKVEIAKKLGLGVGEVSLVIGLYKGEK